MLSYHPGLEQAVEQHHLPIASAEMANNRLFALIIGINKYQDENIRNLEGCIRDSENVCRFLTESLHANPLHIRHLRDSEATRKGILSAFEEHLINNQEIHQNDAIVFYFAGHGSYEIPEENYIAGNKMETICPYDDRTGVRGIPDRTFASLTRRLAILKGNNIVSVIICSRSTSSNLAFRQQYSIHAILEGWAGYHTQIYRIHDSSRLLIRPFQEGLTKTSGIEAVFLQQKSMIPTFRILH
jgi:hypothetical protein